MIEDGRAMLVLGGGDASSHILATAQIVRPGKPTELGHAMTEETLGHCSTTLTDGSVIVTGGRSGATQEAAIKPRSTTSPPGSGKR